MNQLDLVIVIVTMVGVASGLRYGFARRSLSWIGWILGAWLATVVSARLLEHVGPAGSSRRLLVGLAMVLVAGSIGSSAGRAVGSRVHRVLTRRRLGTVDTVLGGFAGVAVVVFTLWILVPAMADVAGWPARAVRESAIARTIVNQLGSPPASLNGLSSGLGLEGLPRVFDSLRSAPSVVAPPDSVPLSTESLAAVKRSVLKVVGDACGRRVSGSGVVIGKELVVTNAHVVAGVTDPIVRSPEDEPLDARVVAFDPARDVAVLRVPGLDRGVVEWGTATPGEAGAAIGYPLGGPQQVMSARIAQQVTAVGRDIYDRDITTRQVLIIGSKLQPGDSGGALVDADGRLDGLVFAVAPDRDGVAYALAPEEVQPVIDAAAGVAGPVDTGPCTG